MSWDTGPAANWKPEPEVDGFGPDGNGGDDGFDVSANGSSSDDDRTCRICQAPDHLARDCPSRPPMACYNCGEEGHAKAECVNERVKRPFDGTCNHCGDTGHRRAQCPNAPVAKCRICDVEGHKAIDCDAKRTDMFQAAPVMSDEEAWSGMKNCNPRDLDEFRRYFNAYCRFMFAMNTENEQVPAVKANELEMAFRKDNFPVYLIAKEKDIRSEYMLVSPSGEIGQKYLLTLHRSDKPPRPIHAEGWPKDAEENLKRLESAGFQLDSGIPVCGNCNLKGHVRKSCPEPAVENAHEPVKIQCKLCGAEGHRQRNCTNRPVETCRNCKQEGHRAAECTNERDCSDVECNVCNEMGHFGRDCPTKPKRTCRNCGDEGHIGKDCPNPYDPSKMTCRNCDEVGHSSRECSKPTDWSRVRCKECGDLGHTIKRCPQAKATADGGGGCNESLSACATGVPVETVVTGVWGGGDDDDDGGVAVEVSGAW